MILPAEWPAPACIKAFTTTREGGASPAPYHTLNMAYHVGDTDAHVTENYHRLKHQMNLPADPIFLEQTHSTVVVKALPENIKKNADASYSDSVDTICTVLTADCLPILICNQQGTHVAAIHAGWRGLANGIIENTLSVLNLAGSDLLVWLGPAIGPNKFEVKADVVDVFVTHSAEAIQAFKPYTNVSWLANIYELARIRLRQAGIDKIYGGNYCTYTDEELFYSYRRDNGKTGRMASLIWIDSRCNFL